MLVLASTSPFRKALLEKLRIPFICVAPNIDETPKPAEPPEALARRLAYEKAKQVADDYPGKLIIGSDQVAIHSHYGQLNKPGNYETAQKQLLACSSARVTFYTGLCLLNTRDNSHAVTVDEFEVQFRPLTEHMVARYLHADQPFQCAGSFKVESLGIRLFTAMSGRDPNSLIGLPLISLCDLLLNAGVDPLDYGEDHA